MKNYLILTILLAGFWTGCGQHPTETVSQRQESVKISDESDEIIDDFEGLNLANENIKQFRSSIARCMRETNPILFEEKNGKLVLRDIHLVFKKDQEQNISRRQLYTLEKRYECMQSISRDPTAHGYLEDNTDGMRVAQRIAARAANRQFYLDQCQTGQNLSSCKIKDLKLKSAKYQIGSLAESRLRASAAPQPISYPATESTNCSRGYQLKRFFNQDQQIMNYFCQKIQ